MKLLFTFLFLSHVVISQNWVQLSDFPALGRDDGAAVTVNNKAYFGTGLRSDWSYSSDFYSLDPLTNAWTAIASMPAGSQRQYAGAFAGPNSFFIFSGDGVAGPLNDLYKYDLATATWSAMASRPGSGIFGSACLEFGDKIIIVGGKFQGSGAATSEIWEYTISTNTWLQKNNFPYGGRFRASAAVYNNTGYMAFGLDNNELFRKEMYAYNQANDSWAKILDFPQAKGRAYAAMKTVGDSLILFGGYDSLNIYHKDIWYFKPANNTWTQSADFISFGRKGGMSTVLNNKFYYSCGIDVNNTRLQETWTIQLPLGVKNYKNDNNLFSVYPNPSHGIFYIQQAALNSTAETVYSFASLDGKIIKEIKMPAQKEIQIDLSDLDPGIYFLKITAGDAVTGRYRVVKD